MFLSSMVYGSLVTSVVRRLPRCRLHRLSAGRHRRRCLRLSRHLRGRQTASSVTDCRCPRTGARLLQCTFGRTCPVQLCFSWPVCAAQHVLDDTFQGIHNLHITSSRLVLVNIAEEDAHLCKCVAAVSFRWYVVVYSSLLIICGDVM